MRLDENSDVYFRKVVDQFLEYRIGRISLVFDAEADRDFVEGVVLPKRGCYTIVEMRLNSFYRADNGDCGRIVGEVGGYGGRLFAREEAEADCVSC